MGSGVDVERSRLALLYRAAETLGVGLDVPKILSRLRDLLIEFTGADRVGIVVFDQHGGAVYRQLVGDYATDEDAERMLLRVFQGGFAARVMRTRQGDIRQPDGRTSLMMVPLLVPERVVGLISLFSRTSDHFTQEHLELLSAIASRAAAVIENRRLFEAERQRANQLAVLNRIAAKLSHSLDLDQVLSYSLESVLGALEFDVGCVYLLSDGEGRLRSHSFLARGGGAVPADGEISLAIGQGVTGRAASTGQVSCVEDVSAGILPVVERGWLDAGAQTVVSVPLSVESRVLAVVTVGSTMSRRLDTETLAWLEAVGDLAGAATANAMRYGDLERIVRARTSELSEANERLAREAVERTQAADALRREHDLVTRIMETSPGGIVMANPSGEITFANARAEQVLGLDKDEITQRTYNATEWQITDYGGNPIPDDQLPFRQVMDSGMPVYDARHAVEWPDGRRVLLSISGAPLIGAAGATAGGVFAVEDITTRVEREQALAHRVRFENLVSNMATRFLSCDAHEIDGCLDSALEALGLFTDVERTYLFVLQQDLVERIFAWCRAGVEPGDIPVQDRSIAEFPWWISQIEGAELARVFFFY